MQEGAIKIRLTKPCSKVKNEKPDHKECNLGYTHEPFSFGFRYVDVVVDLLHLFLRISGTLLEGFRAFLRNLDDITSDKQIIDYKILEKQRFYYGYVKVLSTTGIPNIVSFKDGIIFKELTGPQYIKLFEQADWSRFTKPIKGYKELSIQKVQEKINKFIKVIYIRINKSLILLIFKILLGNIGNIFNEQL